MYSRRAFLKSSGIGLFGIGLLGGIPSFVVEAVTREKLNPLFSKRKVLVCIFQRGAMDGLMAVTPFEDNFLKEARPNLFIAPQLKNNRAPGLIDLDGRFGLHPAMSSFEPLFKDGRLAIVHGIGSPNTTRSHFDAQDYMESGTPFKKSTSDGWLNRAVGLTGHENVQTPFSAISLTSALPRSLYGDHDALAISNIKNFKIQGAGKRMLQNAKSFEELYDDTADELLNEAGGDSFDSMKILQQKIQKEYIPAQNAKYPATNLGSSLKQVAQLIKMDVGLEVAFTESNGWDTHYNQGKDTGIFARNVGDLSDAIVAFWNDIEAYQDDVLVMTMTEFGRTVHQNGTGGTDHGRASCNFILGNHVSGGKIHGVVDPLAVENLEDGRDLKVTTDFRAVFSEVSQLHLNVKDNNSLFPEWDGKNIGVMR
ncbi:DUF1501 domain-containing protein [Sphingobacterium alkalisoli]|uniref:DUF1501 domain-containing protein n=1 Tax=Sphingobacterium alkalisoli TaxID=1874115 RepID=A0A4U0GZ16_9SPHI|nr:DUF1501 domain-containing protein [Sphingobacterium alkalisoli]TJY63974.1 DUF1501 domain-containing protein [Sphingobacterium alkalisoli]GGH23705.1 hypothetical protein GCM10011418_31090 [Sphingobacterium alkalisoli]